MDGLNFLLPGGVSVRVGGGVSQANAIERHLELFKTGKEFSRPTIDIKENVEFKAKRSVDDFGFLDGFVVFFDRFGSQAFVRQKRNRFEVFLDPEFTASFFTVQTLTWMVKKALNNVGGDLVHGAGLSLNGGGFLFPAFPNVGKTSVALELLGNGFGFLGDDKVILLDKKIYCFHPNLTLLYYNFESRPFLLNRVFGSSFFPGARVGLAGLIRKWSSSHPTAVRFSDKFVFPAKTIPIGSVFSSAGVVGSCGLDNAFFLSNFDTEIELGVDSFTERVLCSNLFEFWCVDKVDVVMASRNGGDYFKCVDRERKILRNNLKCARLGELVVEGGFLSRGSWEKLAVEK